MLPALVIILGMIVILFVSIWISLALALEDNSVPIKWLSAFRNILIIYPHPDDETLTSGGMIQMLSQRGARTTLLLLTKGERGTPDASLQVELKKIRAKEATRSAKLLGFSEFILEDMGDGQLIHKKSAVTKKIRAVLRRIKPDLIITYDRSGLYGHPDHMIVSDVVTGLVASEFKHTTLWYFAFSKFMFGATKLPVHMAESKKFQSLRSVPTHRIWIGTHVIAKLRALYCHRSQLPSFRKAVPLGLPLWFVHSTRLFEYYAEVQPSSKRN